MAHGINDPLALLTDFELHAPIPRELRRARFFGFLKRRKLHLFMHFGQKGDNRGGPFLPALGILHQKGSVSVALLLPPRPTPHAPCPLVVPPSHPLRHVASSRPKGFGQLAALALHRARPQALRRNKIARELAPLPTDRKDFGELEFLDHIWGMRRNDRLAHPLADIARDPPL